MNKFIVCCHGWSSSNWLAYTINSIPLMVATHSSKNVVAKDIREHALVNLRKNVRKYHEGYEKRDSRTLNEMFAGIPVTSETLALGSVQVYRLRDLKILNFEEHDVVITNYLRNPIDLVWSGYGQLQDLFIFDINELWFTTGKVLTHGKDFVYDLADRYKLNLGDYEVLAFLGACAIMIGLKSDFDVAREKSNELSQKNFCHFKMEDLTTNSIDLQKFIQHISRNEINLDETQAQRILNEGAINSHRHDSKPIRGADRYIAFTDWQKESFSYFMDKFDLKNEYEKIGYDLSCLNSMVN